VSLFHIIKCLIDYGHVIIITANSCHPFKLDVNRRP